MTEELPITPKAQYNWWREAASRPAHPLSDAGLRFSLRAYQKLFAEKPPVDKRWFLKYWGELKDEALKRGMNKLVVALEMEAKLAGDL